MTKETLRDDIVLGVKNRELGTVATFQKTLIVVLVVGGITIFYRMKTGVLPNVMEIWISSIFLVCAYVTSIFWKRAIEKSTELNKRRALRLINENINEAYKELAGINEELAKEPSKRRFEDQYLLPVKTEYERKVRMLTDLKVEMFGIVPLLPPGWRFHPGTGYSKAYKVKN